ncbi:MAG: hypothetical protein LIO39_01445 [Lachnospiraceae bacterium]|nr:hypothetical protein [Lachnospiraceae bacterium]
MLNEIITLVGGFGYFLILAVVCSLAAALVLSGLLENFTLRTRRRRLFGFFLGMTGKDILWLCLATCWMIYTGSLLLPIDMTAAYAVPYGIFILARLAIRPRAASLLWDAVNAVVLYLAAFFIAAMREYIFGIKFDRLLFIVYILLCVTVVNYAVYLYLRDLVYLTRERSIRHNGTVRSSDTENYQE